MVEQPCVVSTLDAHNDSIILREVHQAPLDFADCNPAYHVDLPRLRAGGITTVFVMVGDSDLLQSLRLIDAVWAMAQNHPDDLAVCLDREQVQAVHAMGRIALVMTIEGQAMFAERLENVRNWHRLGVRVASLTHGEGNRGGRGTALQYDSSHFGYLDPSARNRLRQRTRGLTPFAVEALQELARLRMPVDLAHVNEAAFWEVLERAEGPVCYTHGNCYSLCPHTRNCTDDMLRALAARGGVIGICFYGCFVDRDQPSLERLVDHFLHALEVAGEDHVGVGTDFDGIGAHEVPVISDAAGLPQLWQALARRGVGDAVLHKVAQGNFLRLLP